MHNVKEILADQEYILNTPEAFGHVKVWQFSPETGEKRLLVEKNNLIVRGGAELLAANLAGIANSALTHFYIGHSTAAIVIANEPPIVVGDTISSFPTSASKGLIKIPFAFSPSFLSEENYSNNVPYFTTFLTQSTPYTNTGAALAQGSYIYSLGLVRGGTPDKLFSKIYFGPVQYDTSQGLAITWGVTFRAV